MLQCDAQDEQKRRWQLSHGDAHFRQHAVRRCGHYLQPPGDQRCSAVEVRLEVDELLFEAVVVGLDVSEARPFCSEVIVVVPVREGHTPGDEGCAMCRKERTGCSR